LTIFESQDPLCKRWELDRAGKAVKSAAAQMTRGSYSVQTFATAADLAALWEEVTTQQSFSASLAHDGSASGEIVTKAAIAAYPGKKTRSKDCFGLKAAPGFMLLDHDSASAEGGMSRGDLYSLLLKSVPGLAKAGTVWRPSGSSHVFHGDADLTGLRGQHLLVMLADASDGPRVVKLIAAQLWLAGHGRIEVSSSGALLQRCPVDTAPSDAARLIFSGADCVAPLQQRRGAAVILIDAGFLDSRAEVPDLTRTESDKLDGLIAQAKQAAMPQALQRRAEHRAAAVARRLPELMKQGVNAGEAQQRIESAIDAAYGGLLLGDFELTAVHDAGRHEVVTVGQVLADRTKWDQIDCLEPLNPGHRGGAADCRLYLHSSSPIAYSLDSGQVYRLRAGQHRLAVGRGSRGELVEQLVAVVAGHDSVFMTDAGPVLLDQGQRTLTVDRLMNLVGSNVVLVGAGPKGAPQDLTREVAVLVLAALNT